MKETKRISILLISIAIFIVLISGGYLVYSAFITSFHLKNTISFNAEGIYCKVQANVYKYSDFETYYLNGSNSIETALNGKAIKNSFLYDNLNAQPAQNFDWEIGELNLSNSNRSIIYVFKVENLTSTQAINIKFNNYESHDPSHYTNSIKEINIETRTLKTFNNSSELGVGGISLEKYNPPNNPSYCYFALISSVASLKEGFEFDNNFEIDLTLI